MFERLTIKGLIKRMKEPGRFSQVIMGPPQIGKTTLVRQLFTHIKIDHLLVSADAVLAGDSF